MTDSKGTLRLILVDQLSDNITALADCDKTRDTVLLCESAEEATHVKHHKKKIALWFAAMRHFAARLREQGYRVDSIKLDDAANTGSLTGELRRAVARHRPKEIVLTQPSEYRLAQAARGWQQELHVPVRLLPDTRFLCLPQEFAQWAAGRKQLRMELFYRWMRKRYAILLQEGKPEGGAWNYDSQNRKPPPPDLRIPPPYRVEPDAVTQDVLRLVASRFADHFGDLAPFHFAVTREQALAALRDFVTHRLARFGDYQDAMLHNEPWLYHSHISPYLNCGLLQPLECIHAAQHAYRQGKAPLNAVEGFIRQILGWREYVRGVYWLKMPAYADMNFLAATRDLPEFYWTGDTKMNCLRQCVATTKENAYAHHIQRLMVLGNFALLIGADPKQVNTWYWIVYADAYQWVELPNVSGMVLFADGGALASKPYAGGGAYINKMSDYCKHCRYNVKQANGPQACPFNSLYWNFLARNRTKLRANPRLGMMFRLLDRMSPAKRAAIQRDSERFLAELYDESDGRA